MPYALFPHALRGGARFGNNFGVNDQLRQKAVRREKRQSACLLAGMGAFWVLVLTMNHLVHVFSTVYIAAR